MDELRYNIYQDGVIFIKNVSKDFIEEFFNNIQLVSRRFTKNRLVTIDGFEYTYKQKNTANEKKSN